MESVETILTKWAYYNRRGNDDQFNASQLLIPPGLPGPVILDGTASQNFLWELLEHRAEIVPTVSGARIYANVNLHVLHSLGTGKNAMRDHGLRRVPQLLTHLSEHLPHDRKVLLVVHKDNVHRAKNWAHPFAKYDVANWGAIDGRNDWNDYDTVVLFGLNHRPTTWANNVFFALRGGPPTSNDWFTNPTWRDYPNVRKEMEVRQLAVDAIQAINRVRCRRVADADGGCDPTDVYAILPTGERGTVILDCLKEEMPGAVVGEWNYTLDGATSRSIRRGSCHEPLLALVDNRPAGELSMSYLRKELGLDERRLRNLRETLRDPGHALNKALTGRGVSYVTDGKGRKARSYLLKAG